MKISPINNTSFGAMVVSLEARLGQHRSKFAVKEFDTKDVLDIDFANKELPVFKVKNDKDGTNEYFRVQPMFPDSFERQYKSLEKEPVNIQIGVQRITRMQ